MSSTRWLTELSSVDSDQSTGRSVTESCEIRILAGGRKLNEIITRVKKRPA